MDVRKLNGTSEDQKIKGRPTSVEKRTFIMVDWGRGMAAIKMKTNLKRGGGHERTVWGRRGFYFNDFALKARIQVEQECLRWQAIRLLRQTETYRNRGNAFSSPQRTKFAFPVTLMRLPAKSNRSTVGVRIIIVFVSLYSFLSENYVLCDCRFGRDCRPRIPRSEPVQNVMCSKR